MMNREGRPFQDDSAAKELVLPRHGKRAEEGTPYDKKVPFIEVDIEGAIRESESIAELKENLSQAGDVFGQAGELLAQKVGVAEDFWQANQKLIVEGVLNTTDDINQKENYIEGSNFEIRQKLGAKVKALGNPELERLVKKLMKKEMAEYFYKNTAELAEAAIKGAPNLPSLFEVVKRFKQIKDQTKDGEKVYLRDNLAKVMGKILEIDEKLNELDSNHRAGAIPERSQIEDLYNHQILVEIGYLPEKFGIREIVANKLMAKVGSLRAISHAEKISSSDSQSSPQPGFFSKVKARFSGWFGKK